MSGKPYNPYKRAKAVYDCWILTLYYKAAINYKKMPLDIFNKPLDIKVDGRKIVTIEEPKEIINIAGINDNLERIVLGACFIAFDEALSDIFGGRKACGNRDIDSLREIIYMFRCAFAHTPTKPKWKIKPTYRKISKIEELNFVMDFRELNGKEVLFKDHGGERGLFKIVIYCLDVINKNMELYSREKAKNEYI